MKIFRRMWIPLVVITLTLIAGMAVAHTRNLLGANAILVTPTVFANDPQPHNPKTVTLDVWGTGRSSKITYLDLDSNPVEVETAVLPWSITLKTTKTSASPTLLAQGEGDSLSCRITVDGVVKSERTSSQMDAFTFCFVKSA